jgi:BirA family biotin operon repressor/biotin-[acetyl-CoA-carboxylase] ligase
MKIYTDNPGYAGQILDPSGPWQPISPKALSPEIQLLAGQLMEGNKLYEGLIDKNSIFNPLFIREFTPFSQFDFLVQYSKQVEKISTGFLCFSGAGRKFHGFRNREWVSMPGNIHLSILLEPRKKISHTDSAFLILAANAVVQTIDSLKRINGQPQIKWVNDIVINDRKVGGVLVQTQIQGEITDRVIIGIGLNVDESPEIESDPFILGTTAINHLVQGSEKYALAEILWQLIVNLERNYMVIMNDEYNKLLNEYISHSLLPGQYIEVFSDPREGESQKTDEGMVTSITENLELVLQGVDHPIRKGRIKVKKINSS